MVAWSSLSPAAWHDSIAKESSIFRETYELTRKAIDKALATGQFDVVIEVGVGTGDILGALSNTSVPGYGLDINPAFLDYCRKQYGHKKQLEFLLQDATKFEEWWKTLNASRKVPFTRPLILCVNNTIAIMPAAIRGPVLAQMLAVAGSNGRVLSTYWNGHFFSHAVVSYYRANPALCGNFDVHEHVDWNTGTLVTPAGYSTHWWLPEDVQKQLRSYDIDVPIHTPNGKIEDGIHCQGLAIFVWFSEDASSHAKRYYDSDDAQRFYASIWGEETIHIGRYDLLTDQDRATLSISQQITKAQELHEEEFLQLVASKIPGKVRVLDMGCGYGGLLRRLHRAGIVWSAVGCDISQRMCETARSLNAKAGMEGDISILEESYLDVSVPDESMDLVISMDALLHVGPERQRRAMAEAARILRPGGWMIFTDIMQKPVVDPKVMQPIYDRIHLSSMGTVENYREALEEVGITNFDFHAFSMNVPAHYGSVRKVLQEKASAIGLSPEYAQKMEAGLQSWVTLGPQNIEWGFVMSQKTEKLNKNLSVNGTVAQKMQKAVIDKVEKPMENGTNTAVLCSN